MSAKETEAKEKGIKMEEVEKASIDDLWLVIDGASWPVPLPR